jgi:hypothetical protein
VTRGRSATFEEQRWVGTYAADMMNGAETMSKNKQSLTASASGEAEPRRLVCVLDVATDDLISS